MGKMSTVRTAQRSMRCERRREWPLGDLMVVISLRIEVNMEALFDFESMIEGIEEV